MIIFISICYSSLYFLIFNKLGLLRKTPGNISAFAGVGVVIIGTIVFAWYTFSPVSSDARMFRYIIPVVPNVRGEVVEVPIKGAEPLQAGDTLFRIDPEPFEIVVRQREAQVQRFEAEYRLAEVNMKRAERLLETQAAAQLDLDTWMAQRDMAAAARAEANAALDDARWQLQETVVKAPYDGHVVSLQLRPGNVVTTMPAASPLAFVSTETNTILASFSQSAIRKVAVGDGAEIVFSNIPGQTFAGEVVQVVQLSSEAQLTASGQLPTFTGAPVGDRWLVLVELNDFEEARAIPQGAGGSLAVYTQSGTPVHVISKVALRMNAWLGYLTSP